MTGLTAIMTVAIAFPKPGIQLPYIERCYVIGSVPRGEQSVVVAGETTTVYRTGAWATMASVHPGTNTIAAVLNGERTEVQFTVAPKPSGGTVGQPAEKKYVKLEYARDELIAHPKGKPAKTVTVVIDPGHGGDKDRGAISPHGWDEKTANLYLAKEVAEELRKFGYKVVMTRTDDRALVLTERPRIAHGGKADAFISIHHNAPAADRPATTRYASVYSWNDAGSALASAIGKRMNDARKDRIEYRGSMHANYAVTRSPEVPSCLLECDFITSPEGEEEIFDRQKRRTLAAAIAAGFADWVTSGKSSSGSSCP